MLLFTSYNLKVDWNLQNKCESRIEVSWSRSNLKNSFSNFCSAFLLSTSKLSASNLNIEVMWPYKAKNASHILKHNQLQSLKGAREEWLQCCWDFVKSPWNDEIALQHFFFLACSSARIFFSISFVLHAIFFFRQGFAGIFFWNHPHPPSRVKWLAPKIISTFFLVRPFHRHGASWEGCRSTLPRVLCANAKPSFVPLRNYWLFSDTFETPGYEAAQLKYQQTFPGDSWPITKPIPGESSPTILFGELNFLQLMQKEMFTFTLDLH